MRILVAWFRAKRFQGSKMRRNKPNNSDRTRRWRSIPLSIHPSMHIPRILSSGGKDPAKDFHKYSSKGASSRQRVESFLRAARGVILRDSLICHSVSRARWLAAPPLPPAHELMNYLAARYFPSPTVERSRFHPHCSSPRFPSLRFTLTDRI